MAFTRRDFLGAAAAFPLAGPGFWKTALAAPNPTVEVLRATTGMTRLVPGDFPETQIWGYDGSTPGPVIRVRQGETIIRRFINELPQPSTVHWHGIRLKNGMDGVPGLTQGLVPPKGEFLYEFDAPDAGTYWYHPHNRTWEQMARGLYGALIVEENEPPITDRDEVLLIDDWRLQPDASIAGGFDAMMDWSHGGRMGNWLTVNGKGGYRQQARHGERLRLRLVNVANARIFPLRLDGLEGWIVALDGQPLARPERAGGMVLAPAQRIDLLVDVVAADGARASINFLSGNDIHPLVRFDIDGRLRAERLAIPAPLAPNPVPPLGDIGTARTVTLRMEGGAMGGMRGAMMGGRMMGMRNLVEAGRVWAFNGVADMPDAPLMAASLGEIVKIDMINDTAWPHAIHLHGHHFRKIAKNGQAGPLRDTLLVDREETAQIAFVADNPGKWLLHCHMLEHAAGGMATWIDVAA